MASFDDGVTMLMLSQPMFGQLLMKYQHVETKAIPTLAVSRTALMYNPDFVATLTDGQMLAAITHEVMHGVYQHVQDLQMYSETGVGPDGQVFNATKMNHAQDYVINDLIKQNKIGDLSPSWLWSSNYTFAMTPQEVYAMLPDPPPDNQPNSAGQSQQDTHDTSGGGNSPGVDDPNARDAITPNDVVQAAAFAESIGRLPAGMDRFIETLRKPQHSPWKMLRKAVTTALGNGDSSTWRKLNRRLITRGIGAPGKQAFGCNRVAIVGDTSGSITDEVLQIFGGHMGAILDEAKPKEIKVLWTDAEVHRIDTVKNGGELRTLMQQPVLGGGGTDMSVGIRESLQFKPDAVVVLTDGYTPWGDDPGIPVVWAIVGGGEMVAPYGTTIHLND